MPNLSASAALPIVIVSGPASMPIALRAGQYYASEHTGASELILLRPQGCGHMVAPPGVELRYVDDEAVPGLARVRAGMTALATKIISFGRSPGWYVQQYLKLAGVRHIAPEGALLTDGDTIFSAQLLTALIDRPAVLTTKERFPNYNAFVAAIGIAPFPESCVANGNVFYPGLLPPEVTDPDGFLEIVERHVVTSGGAADFSEYQLMGSIAAPAIGWRRVRMFRRFDMLARSGTIPSQEKIAQALRRYDAIAFEQAHRRSPIRRIAAELLFRLNYSW